MAIGTTNIKMSDIATELQYASTGLADNSMVNILYDSSQLSYSIHGGSYHNLNMLVSSLAKTFKIAIETRYSAGTYLWIGGWAGYDHDAPAQLAYIINNGSGADVAFDLYIGANNTPGSGTNIFSGIVPRNNGGNINANPYNTGVGAYSTFSSSGGYWISGNISVVVGSPVFVPVEMKVTAAVDLDNVGGATARYNYTNEILSGAGFDLNPMTGGVAFNDVLVSGANGSAFPTNGISWNKRTSIIIDIT